MRYEAAYVPNQPGSVPNVAFVGMDGYVASVPQVEGSEKNPAYLGNEMGFRADTSSSPWPTTAPPNYLDILPPNYSSTNETPPIALNLGYAGEEAGAVGGATAGADYFTPPTETKSKY